ncbi:DUF3624 domain-containing protein [Vibrio sp. RC27]
MACNSCDKNWFFKKIGRCNRCIKQLTVLCLITWVFWFVWGTHNSRQVETIAVLIFGLGFHLLLIAHLGMKLLLLNRSDKHRL